MSESLAPPVVRAGQNGLFPAIEPYRHGMLAVDDIHTLYWEEVGNPNGLPVVFLHGGPGSGLSPLHRCFFDPASYRVILFDQRGSGKSTPQGEMRNNTTPLLVADIEALRSMLGIEQWLVFGGSWGSTLALAYAQSHPTACLGLILRGIFLCSQAEVDWFVHGARWFHPKAHQAFLGLLQPEERGDVLHSYLRRLSSPDPAIHLPAARVWSYFEGHRVSLLPPPPSLPGGAEQDASDLAIARMEALYMANGAFMAENQLLDGVALIRHLPCVIIQGRYDVICPPLTAWQLHQAWPEARMRMVEDAGHSGFEPGITRALVAATEQFKTQRNFA
jgi:proline iminopeptidase